VPRPPPESNIRERHDPVIGVLSTAMTLEGNTFVQMSRLGNPLVNEAVIGLPDKDNFNASYPQNTVTPSEMLRLNTSTMPTPPGMQNDLGVLGGDLAGFPNGRRPYDDVTDIELRALEGALCGVAGKCGTQTTDPNKGAPYTDGARAAGPDASHLMVSGKVDPTDTYLDVFPYLNTPLPGSPSGATD